MIHSPFLSDFCGDRETRPRKLKAGHVRGDRVVGASRVFMSQFSGEVWWDRRQFYHSLNPLGRIRVVLTFGETSLLRLLAFWTGIIRSSSAT